MQIIQFDVYLHRKQTNSNFNKPTNNEMIKEIAFTKMHGLGNDYIFVDCTKETLPNPEANAIAWSKYHVGIGSDGLILIESSKVADFRMRMFNADGSEGEMCGNGTRCIGKFVYEKGLTKKSSITLETLAGIKVIQLTIKKDDAGNEYVPKACIDMGIPVNEQLAFRSNTPEEMIDQEFTVDGQTFRGTAVSMGNPHIVIFVDDMAQVPLAEIGPKIETLPMFPNRTNVEFVQVTGKDELRMRVWERGSGITQACGTGACATAVAACLTGRASNKSIVTMDGGPVSIEWKKEEDKHLFMDGPATTVFEGTVWTVE